MSLCVIRPYMSFVDPYKSLFVIVNSNGSLWVLVGPDASLLVLMGLYRS